MPWSRPNGSALRPALLLLTFLLVCASYAAGSFSVGTAKGKIPAGTTAVSKGEGFDICQSTTPTALNKWWEKTNYWEVGIYIGGKDGVEACATPNEEWVSAVHVVHHSPGVREIGWDFIPIFDGSQSPCDEGAANHHFSLNPETATEEGGKEADAAVAAAENRGFTKPGTVIYLDLEGYNYLEPTCDKATKQFVNNWVRKVQSVYHDHAGVYSSAEGADWKAFCGGSGGIANPPDDAWIAQANYEPSVFAVNSNVPSNCWVEEQRLHQWSVGEAEEPIGGPALTIDHDCAWGLVAGWEAGAAKACYEK